MSEAKWPMSSNEGRRSMAFCSSVKVAREVKPEVVGLISNRKMKICSGLIIVITTIGERSAGTYSIILNVEVVADNLEIFISDVGGKLSMKVQKTENPINKACNGIVTVGVATV